MAQFLRWRLQELTASKSKDPAGTVKNHLNALLIRSAAIDYTPEALIILTVASRQLLAAARRLRKVQRGIPTRDFADGGKALLRLLQDEGQEATKRARQR